MIQTIEIPRHLVKSKLAELRYSMKALAQATRIPYNTMNGYLNGYVDKIPVARMNAIMTQLENWEGESET